MVEGEGEADGEEEVLFWNGRCLSSQVARRCNCQEAVLPLVSICRSLCREGEVEKGARSSSSLSRRSFRTLLSWPGLSPEPREIRA